MGLRDARYTAQRPQGVLQPFRQGYKTFAAEHDVGVLEAGERQTEVVEPAVQRLAGDGDAEIGDLGEVPISPCGPADVLGGRSPPDPGRSPPATP